MDESKFVALSGLLVSDKCEKYITMMCLDGKYVLFVDSENDSSGMVEICKQHVGIGEALDFSAHEKRCTSHFDMEHQSEYLERFDAIVHPVTASNSSGMSSNSTDPRPQQNQTRSSNFTEDSGIDQESAPSPTSEPTAEPTKGSNKESETGSSKDSTRSYKSSHTSHSEKVKSKKSSDRNDAEDSSSIDSVYNPNVINEDKNSDSKNHDDRIKVACVGDSITYGYGASSPAHSYPSNLQLLLGDNFIVRDYGQDGVTAQKLAATKEGSYWHTKFFRWSHEFLPQIVIIMLGTNDSKEPNWHRDLYTTDLADLIISYQELPSSPDIYLMIPPRALPTEFVSDMQIQPDVISGDIPVIMKKISSKLKTHLINLSSIFITHPKDPEYIYKKGEPGFWSGDGVHPNDGGYDQLAKVVFNSFNRKSYYGKLMPSR
jgi:lysophospholipase L1-like esterase